VAKKQESQTKEYKTEAEFDKDAHKMLKAGWRVGHKSVKAPQVRVGRSIVKAAFTLSILPTEQNLSRTPEMIVVTWVRER
jgi:hypothetical protein